MKKFSFLALAASAMMLASCSSSDDLNTDQGAKDALETAGAGFFKLNLNLPSSNVTRADWTEEDPNTMLHDGKSSEWAVKSVVIALFEGADEASATLVQVNTITSFGFADVSDDPNQITQNDTYVMKVDNTPSGNLYALAILNGEGILQQGSGNELLVNGATAYGASTKIQDLQDAISQASATGANKFVDASDYIFMTNAVLSFNAGGKNDPTATPSIHVLAEVNKARIEETEAAAAAGEPAVDIYVERGVAKVTLDEGGLAAGALKRQDGTTLAASTLSGWCLDNTNMSSYIVRQYKPTTAGGGTAFDWNLVNNLLTASTTTDKYRFVGNTPVDGYYGTTLAGFRTYWCFDPNYGIDYNKANFYEPKTKTFVTATGDTNPLYCYENTFDVEHQTYENTTRAIVAITLNGGADFYTVGADRKTLWTEKDIQKQIAAYLLTIASFSTYYSTYGNASLNSSSDDIEITWNSDSKAGVVKVSEITIPKKYFTDDTERKITKTTAAPLDNVITDLNSKLTTIKRYVGGVSYYNIRIKHFGDDLTPWNSGEATPAPAEATVDKIYPATARDANYLGRYGLVRNNWYEIKLGDILKIGSPIISWINPDNDPNPDPSDPDDPNPDDPDHPDDSLEDAYISARINILSWAKRPQSWPLK